MCIVEFTGHLLPDRDTTSSMETEMEGNDNGNGNEPLVMGGNRIEKDIPAHL